VVSSFFKSMSGLEKLIAYIVAQILTNPSHPPPSASPCVCQCRFEPPSCPSTSVVLRTESCLRWLLVFIGGWSCGLLCALLVSSCRREPVVVGQRVEAAVGREAATKAAVADVKEEVEEVSLEVRAAAQLARLRTRAR
jgi:hypothetical protein